MKLFSWSLLLAVLASTAAADQLMVTGQTKEGDFQGYSNGKFELMTTKGRLVKEHATGVTKLVLTKPEKVTYQTSDGKKEETAELKGYDKRAFTFLKDDKEVVIPQMKMKMIALVAEEGGDQQDGTRYPIPDVNLDSFAGDDITPAQQAVIDKFKAAKKSYDAYLDESTTMVREMDKETGAKREAFLNQLRARKIDEQPLKKALVAAYKALTDVFPEPSDRSVDKQKSTPAFKSR